MFLRFFVSNIESRLVWIHRSAARNGQEKAEKFEPSSIVLQADMSWVELARRGFLGRKFGLIGCRDGSDAWNALRQILTSLLLAARKVEIILAALTNEQQLRTDCS